MQDDNAGMYYEVGVPLADANTPVFYFSGYRVASYVTLVTFENFTATAPEDFLFDVPQVCQKLN